MCCVARPPTIAMIRPNRLILPNASNWSGDTSFFGDYIYNQYMGKSEQVANTAGTGYVWSIYVTDPHLAQIPGNVMLLVEAVKPNFSSRLQRSTMMAAAPKLVARLVGSLTFRTGEFWSTTR